jgi:preprotein translocase subunit SecB
MEASTQIKLRFTGVDIFSVNFSSLKAFNEDDDRVTLDIQPKVFYPEDDHKSFKIIMDVKIGCQDYFDISLIAMGNFEFNIDVEDREVRKKFVTVNAVGIVFPYIRSFVATFTSNLGKTVKPILIPTQFFKGELEELQTSSLQKEPLSLQ